MITPDNAVAAGKASVLQIPITVEDSGTGLFVTATGEFAITGIAVTVAATEGGDPIGGVALACAEYSGTPGTYRTLITGDTATVIIAGCAGKIACWLHLVADNDFDEWYAVPIARVVVTS